MKSRFFATWVVAFVGLAAALAPAAAQLPQLGDGQDLSTSEERALGDRIARSLLRDPDAVDDPVLGAYVHSVWQPLLDAARARGELPPEMDERFAWRIVLGRDRTVNAFALPGGYLGVHLGLLAVVGSRDELASVLGHELSHVTQRHIARLISKSNRETPWMLGAMILGAIAAGRSAEGGSAVMAGSQALAAQSQLNFSRDMEREADRIGFGVMTQAGFAPEGFVTMFDKLQQAARLNDTGAYPYLRSHPLTTERIADMQSRLPLGAPHPSPPQPDWTHALMMTRAQLLAQGEPDVWRSWLERAQDARRTTWPLPEQARTLYGAAWSAHMLRDHAQAQAWAQQLLDLAQAHQQPPVMVLGLQAEMALNQPQGPSPQQAQRLGAALEPWRQGMWQRPVLDWQAQLALYAQDRTALESSAQRLQGWLLQHPLDGVLWQDLAGLHERLGQPLRALRAQAEVQVARMDLPAALDRLRAAQDRVRQNPPREPAPLQDAAIIDARLRQLQTELRAQQTQKP